MKPTNTDVLDVVAATRPARTIEQIQNALNAVRARAGQPATGSSAVRSALSELTQQGVVIRLQGDDAAECGAYPQHFARNTAFWISADHYRSYRPGAELPAPPQHKPKIRCAPDPMPIAPTIEPQHAEAELDTDATTNAVIAELDTLRSSVQKRALSLAGHQADATSPVNRLTRGLTQLLLDLGHARYALITATTPSNGAPVADNGVVLPQFSAAD